METNIIGDRAIFQGRHIVGMSARKPSLKTVGFGFPVDPHLPMTGARIALGTSFYGNGADYSAANAIVVMVD